MLQTVSTKLQRIALAAVQYPGGAFKNVAHLIDVDFLQEAFKRVNPKSSPGCDGETWQSYATNLGGNLRNLYERMKTIRYRAQPVERVWLEKEEGKKRPIGKPVLEDKIAQRAVTMILEAIYEKVFYSFSYGFRIGRSPLDALRELRELCMGMNIKWILDADVSGFFDSINHALLLGFIRKRVKDKNILRLIGKWLKAGVLEEGKLYYPEAGTPQGGVISPMLANIFLHHVLDEWFVKEVLPRMKGRCFLIRFADDFIIAFELEEDARRVKEVLPKRFARYKLTIHPEKTKLVRFGKPASRKETKCGNGTFDFLGFTHYWTKSLRGYWVIKRKTIAKRLRRFVKSVWIWCRNNRHMPFKEQYRKLCQKLRGYYQYFGIRGNYKMLEVVYEQTERAWRFWLSRRSHKGTVTWEKFDILRMTWPLPKPRIIHSI